MRVFKNFTTDKEGIDALIELSTMGMTSQF